MEEWPGYGDRFNGSLHRDLGHLRVTVEETKQRQAELTETIAGEQQKREALVRTLLERHEELKLDFEGLRHACVNQLEGLRKKTDDQAATLSKHRARLAELHEDHEEIRQLLQDLREEVAGARPQKQLKAQLQELVNSSLDAHRGQQQQLWKAVEESKRSISEHASSWERTSADLAKQVRESRQSIAGHAALWQKRADELSEQVESALKAHLETERRSPSQAAAPSSKAKSRPEAAAAALRRMLPQDVPQAAAPGVSEKVVEAMEDKCVELWGAVKQLRQCSSARNSVEPLNCSIETLAPQHLVQKPSNPGTPSNSAAESLSPSPVRGSGSGSFGGTTTTADDQHWSGGAFTAGSGAMASGSTSALTTTDTIQLEYAGSLPAPGIAPWAPGDPQMTRPNLLHIGPAVGVQAFTPHPQSSPYQFGAMPIGATAGAAPATAATPPAAGRPMAATLAASLPMPPFSQLAAARRLMVSTSETSCTSSGAATPVPPPGVMAPGNEGLRRSASWSGLNKGAREGAAAGWHGVAATATNAWQPGVLRRCASGSAIMANSKVSSTTMQAPSSGMCSSAASNATTVPGDSETTSCRSAGMRGCLPPAAPRCPGFTAPGAQFSHVMQAKVLSVGLPSAQFAAQVTSTQP
mmetsp:Transcript_114346/g.220158  ORF Transcript_114346/g.220158 Transcript_114346/m.220158 type:complete len:639 (-) Transcript_114346:200-2116(-)